MYEKHKYEKTIEKNGNTYRFVIHEENNGVNVIKVTYDIYGIKVKTETEYTSTAYQLRKVVANWYIILRNMSLVALLSILVYVGIRIMISSTAADKSKYKQMLMDWLVAICLLFVLHYIMAFANLTVKKIIDIVDSTAVANNTSSLPDDVKGKEISKDGVVL